MGFDEELRPKDGPPGGDSNGWSDFKGEKRSNETHASVTDPEARLARKGAGREAKLAYSTHGLMENRNGLLIDLVVSTADGFAERREGAKLIAKIAGSRHSQVVRRKIEKIFGWLKSYGGLKRSRVRGLAKTQLAARLAAAAYNLLRIARLQPSGVAT